MNRITAWLLAPLTALAWLLPVVPAHADDPRCNDLKDDCVIVIVDPGHPSDPDPGDPDPAPKEKVVPDLSLIHI